MPDKNDIVIGKVKLMIGKTSMLFIGLLLGLLLGLGLNNIYTTLVFNYIPVINFLQFTLIFMLIAICYSIGTYFVYNTRPSNPGDRKKDKL